MNTRNVPDALKLYVGESKDCVTFSGWFGGSRAVLHALLPSLELQIDKGF
jgi:hypothetical protein